MKTEKKTTWVFVYLHLCGKFWSISLELFIKHKPLISVVFLYLYAKFKIAILERLGDLHFSNKKFRPLFKAPSNYYILW